MDDVLAMRQEATHCCVVFAMCPQSAEFPAHQPQPRQGAAAQAALQAHELHGRFVISMGWSIGHYFARLAVLPF